MKVKIKKSGVFKVLTCTVLILLLCAVGVSASTNIDKVYVTDIDAPVAGMAPDYTGVLPSSAYYTFGNPYSDPYNKNGICWWDKTTETFLDPNTAKFAEGHQYTVYVTLVPSGGYRFLLGAEGFEGYLNENLSTEEGGSAGDVCTVAYTFPVESIKNVSVYELENPVPGGVPDFRAVVSDPRYALLNVEWYDVTGNTLQGLHDGYLFQAGRTYQAIIELSAVDENCFAVDSTGQKSAVSATVNGFSCKVQAGDQAEKSIFVIREYTLSAGGNPFADVKTSAFYYDSVLWAVERGITIGTSATTFEPKKNCTRGEIVTFLWRAYGCPAPSITKNPFTDVDASAYYYDAVLWAVGKGITIGTGGTFFSPDMICTRSQAVTFQWRAEGKPVSNMLEVPFVDVEPGSYYVEAVLWAVQNEITKGTGPSTFSPEQNCSRGEIVTLLYRTLASRS